MADDKTKARRRNLEPEPLPRFASHEFVLWQVNALAIAYHGAGLPKSTPEDMADLEDEAMQLARVVVGDVMDGELTTPQMVEIGRATFARCARITGIR